MLIKKMYRIEVSKTLVKVDNLTPLALLSISLNSITLIINSSFVRGTGKQPDALMILLIGASLGTAYSILIAWLGDYPKTKRKSKIVRQVREEFLREIVTSLGLLFHFFASCSDEVSHGINRDQSMKWRQWQETYFSSKKSFMHNASEPTSPVEQDVQEIAGGLLKLLDNFYNQRFAIGINGIFDAKEREALIKSRTYLEAFLNSSSRFSGQQLISYNTKYIEELMRIPELAALEKIAITPTEILTPVIVKKSIVTSLKNFFRRSS